ncbi:MAG: sigma-70 family RNA polymerase sigma factor [Candidatus Omnitrophota bacterium]|jgi:RNA polymerase sigma-70 factor (ECF subfamily)|nr:MAG: sigma-70 family RNA polymerase sigma factor [Candidatus Omnitrophota bacterium]
MQGIFRQALNQLTDAERIVLVLHDVDNESYQEIANHFHIQINNVRTRLWRAREKLRRILKPYIAE